MTRCAGLVEIDESRLQYLEELVDRYSEGIIASQREEDVSRYMRGVKFIHKTVVEFLRNRAIFFQESSWQASATLYVLRSRIRVASLTPITVSHDRAVSRPITLDRGFVRQMLYHSPMMEAAWPVQKNGGELVANASQRVDQAYHLWDYVTQSHDEPEDPFLEAYGRCNFIYFNYEYFPTLRHCLGFATFFGCYDYVSQHVSKDDCSRKELDYLLSCAILGFHDFFYVLDLFSDLDFQLLVNLLKVVLELLLHAADPNMEIEVDDSHKHGQRNSKWSFFIQNTLRIAKESFWSRKWSKIPTGQRFPQLSSLFKDVLTSFLNHNADVNVIVVGDIFLENRSTAQGAKEKLRIELEETALAYITRQIKSQYSHSVEGFEDLFKSWGGLERSSVRSVSIGRSFDIYMEDIDLTVDQSEDLMEELPWFSAGESDLFFYIYGVAVRHWIG